MADRAPADLSQLHAIVPVRGSGDGKTRLGLAIDAEERQALVLGMLVHTLNILAAWPACRLTHVVSTDPDVLAATALQTPYALPMHEAGGGDLNAALRAGRARAQAAGATAILCLPIDLPLLSTAALDGLLRAADAAVAAGHGRPVVVLAPSEARQGTNALLLAPPDTIEPHFGESSLEAHLRAAAAADASIQLVSDPGLGFDLDTPDDLERLETGRLIELQRLGQLIIGALAPLAQGEVV